MRLKKFDNFQINERLGVSKASLLFIDPLEMLAWSEFRDFVESNEQKLDKIVKIGYRRIRPFITDWSAYVDFPCVGFELVLTFKKMATGYYKSKYVSEVEDKDDVIRVGGSASGFGHKNWKNYSKIVEPIKKLSEIGIIIQIGIDIDIDKSEFDLENPTHYNELEDGIKSTLYHELNHAYEHFKRTIRGTMRSKYKKPVYDRSFNTSLTYAENNIWKFPKPIWKLWSNKFLSYIYFSESFELNANVQEMYYHLTKYPNKPLNDFIIYQNAEKMEQFNPETFYQSLIEEISKHEWKDLGNFTFYGIQDSEKIANKLKDMWVSVYKKEVDLQKANPIIPFSTLEKMSCKQFINYWAKEFNKNGRYLKNKIQKLKNSISQGEEII